MKISHKIKNLECTCSITLDNQEIQEIKEKILTDIASKITLPGFRAGKVPKNVIMQKYKDHIEADIKDTAIKQSLKKFFEENPDVMPISSPTLTESELSEKNLSLKITFEVFPEVKNIDFSKIKLEKNTLKLDEKNMNESLNRVAEYYQDYIEVSRLSQDKDKVTIDFEGKLNGIPFDGGSATNFDLILGSKSFIEGFEDQLIGKNAGDNLDVQVTFPEKYHVKELAGKPAVFSVKIHKVLEPKLHEINDELAKKTGNNSLADLKKTIEQSYVDQMNKIQFSMLRKDLFEQLAKKYKFDIPPKMLEKEQNQNWEQYIAYKKHMEEHKAGMHADHVHNEKDPYEGMSEKEIKKLREQEVETKLRSFIIIKDFAQKEKIAVSENDLNRAILDKASEFPGQEQLVYDYYAKNKEALDELHSSLLEKAVVEKMLSQVSYDEKETTVEEFSKKTEETRS